MRFAALLLLFGCGDGEASTVDAGRRVVFVGVNDGGKVVRLVDAGDDFEPTTLSGFDGGEVVAGDAAQGLDADQHDAAATDGGCPDVLEDVEARCAALNTVNSLNCETCDGVKRCVCGASVNRPECVFLCG